MANVGVFKNHFVLPIHVYEEEGEEFIVVCLIAWGNKVLCKVCYTADWKEVWCFLSYEFMVHKDSLSVMQVSGSFYYTRIRLIELIDPNCLSLLYQCSPYYLLWSPATFFLYKQYLYYVYRGYVTL